jgi:hypothetical protein
MTPFGPSSLRLLPGRSLARSLVRFLPQTAKRWPDYCRKPRNAGPIIATSHETKIFAAKYA